MGLAAARRQEIAVRLSLGAARARLVRQLLTESVLLATAAGAAALSLVWLVLRAATQFVPMLPFEIALTWPATTFTFGVALAVGLAFGLAPALHGTRVTLAGALHDSGRTVAGGRNRLQRALVVAQVTFTQPLIVLLVTVLLITFGELQPQRQTEFGDRLINVQLHPPPSATAEPEELRATIRRLTERLQGTPGVEAALIDWRGASPLGYYVVHPEDRVAGASEEALRLSGERAAPGYFAALGIPLVQGRDFAPTEVAPAEPRPAHVDVVIGADLARRLWHGANPVGRRLWATSDSARAARTLTVVGVIDDPTADNRRVGERVRVYLPPDTTRLAHVLLLRTTGAASPLLPAVRSAVHEETDGMLADVHTLAELEHVAQRNRRLAASGLSVAGVMALLLSAIGLYAVVAFSVGQRTREIAVRLAVGAPGGRIVRRFVADGVRLGAIGLALGLPFGLFGLRTLLAADNDFPALPVGPVTATTAIGAIATAVVAAWLPARRAARVDPAAALRAE